jgi:DNA-binding NarL/FixJ family response regulator
VNTERYEAELREAVARAREAMEPRPRGARCSALCPAEKRVLRLIGLGLSNDEIGEALGIGHETVRTYAKRLHDKCAVEGRTRLAIAALLVGNRTLLGK